VLVRISTDALPVRIEVHDLEQFFRSDIQASRATILRTASTGHLVGNDIANESRP
jgi:hypothetical protein